MSAYEAIALDPSILPVITERFRVRPWYAIWYLMVSERVGVRCALAYASKIQAGIKKRHKKLYLNKK